MPQTVTIPLPGKQPEKSEVQAEIRDGQVYITGLPDGHTLEYVARDVETKSKLYVVHRPEEFSLDAFRLHIGAEAELVEAQVQKVRRYFDGGTTLIDYILAGNQGELYFPSPAYKDKKPRDRYQGKTIELEKLI
ncbi:TPA: hypothetical protein HA239_03390 [Candidatus Woesearchaeota archaeon]|nr:hypothetical protein QT06_C0001G0036 [archaeon GW2011_AR15]MBS3104155.1 hypothetical protein [Candidatus Woesearchaeota archaeon]HIH41435.1 hypothetical protein [Candidatus Woesearchaeota archaeon]